MNSATSIVSMSLFHNLSRKRVLQSKLKYVHRESVLLSEGLPLNKDQIRPSGGGLTNLILIIISVLIVD